MKTAVVYLSGGNAEKAKDVIDEAVVTAKKAKLPDLEKECINLSVDCAEVHLSRGEFADAADIASELAAMFKAQGNRQKAATMLKLQIQAHVSAGEGNWALTATKNDLVRLWKGVDKKQEALALIEVAKLYVAFRDTANVAKTSREAIAILEEVGEVEPQAMALRCIMQAHMADEETKDTKSAAKVAKECLALGKDKSNATVEAYGLLWTGTVAAQAFFDQYIPLITAWKDPSFKGKRREKDLRIPEYEKAMKQVDKAYLMFEDLKDEEGMQEAFEFAYALQQKANSTQDPAKTTHIFKNGFYDHTEVSYDYAAVKEESEAKTHAQDGRPFTRKMAVDMMQALIDSYSSSKFQQDLKQAYEDSAGDAKKFNAAKNELFAPIQKAVLPTYGFDGGPGGAMASFQATQKYLGTTAVDEANIMVSYWTQPELRGGTKPDEYLRLGLQEMKKNSQAALAD
jgi:hypothetical protein